MAGDTPWCPSISSSCLVFITSFHCISPCASLVFVDSVGWYRLHLCRVLCFHFLCGNTIAQVLVRLSSLCAPKPSTAAASSAEQPSSDAYRSTEQVQHGQSGSLGLGGLLGAIPKL
jgi:hypothetical protein